MYVQINILRWPVGIGAYYVGHMYTHTHTHTQVIQHMAGSHTTRTYVSPVHMCLVIMKLMHKKYSQKGNKHQTTDFHKCLYIAYNVNEHIIAETSTRRSDWSLLRGSKE